MPFCTSRKSTLSSFDDDAQPFRFNEKSFLPPPARPTDEDLLDRLSKVREQVGDAKLDWYVVPSEDEHQSEFVAPSEERRAWLTGFNGSAGAAIVPRPGIDAKALLLVDSRYWIQAENQAPKSGWQVVRLGSTGASGSATAAGGLVNWIVKEVENGSRIGIDPKLISIMMANGIQSQLEDRDSSTKLIPVERNLVDATHEPISRPLAPFINHEMRFAGETTVSKLARMRKVLSERIDVNVRCLGDTAETPVGYAYLVLTKDDCVLFADSRKIPENLEQRLEQDGVTMKEYGVEEVVKYVKGQLEAERTLDEKKKIRIWTTRECNWALSKLLESSESSTKLEIIPCPIEIAKAIKNPIEQEGHRQANLRDGRAHVRYFAWLEDYLVKQKKPIKEWVAIQMLVRLRKSEQFYALGADIISASGPNAALPHYMPSRATESPIEIEAPYLVDSGWCYLDSTLDTTRTVYMGSSPSAELKRAYTRVLQGHMGIATAIFPRGMSSAWMVGLGKEPLYKDKLDFAHGIGHGVGTCLGVHEFPVSFPAAVSFEPGHITTVEPGYYQEGDFGVRIENCYLCKEIEEEEPPKEGLRAPEKGHWLCWERLTQVPIPNNMVDWSLLNKPEIQWLNDHNNSVQEALLPLLQEDRDAMARDWLKKNCKPHRIWPWT